MMKNFLKIAINFSIPLILFLGLNELIVRTIPNEYTTKIKFFEQQRNKIEVLILGSSHALRGINPHELKNKHAYNLAMVSQPLALDHRLLIKYKNSLPKLQFVIISISQFTLSQTLSEGEIKERLPYYKHFYQLNMPELRPTSSDYYFIQFAVDFTFTASRIFRLIMGSRMVLTDSLGWMGTGGKKLVTEKDFIKDAADAASRHENNSNDFDNNLRLLKEIIDCGETNHIKIIFINTPKTKWYTTALDTNKSIRINESIMKLIRETNASYIDLSDSNKFNLNDFRNSDHLNERGAKKLTLILNNYIKP